MNTLHERYNPPQTFTIREREGRRFSSGRNCYPKRFLKGERVDVGQADSKETNASFTLGQYIDHFDRYFFEEGLPSDWYDLKKKVGFSMDSQMNLLKGTDKESVALWTQQTRQDMLAFCLEYLSQELVFPFRYEIQKGYGGARLADLRYGKEMLEMVSQKERNGAVTRSLTRIKDFFLSPTTPDRAVAIMPSPAGPSGLTTDDGKPITYPDAYWFVMVKVGNEVRGCTIKTDFSLEECRLAIERFTGKKLSASAPLEEYVESVAFLSHKEGSITEKVVEVLQSARTNNNPFAFKDKSWGKVISGIEQGDRLYEFNEETQQIIKEFVEYATGSDYSELELRKALAATMLRLSKLFLIDEDKIINTSRKGMNVSYKPIPYVKYGDVLSKVEKISGCAGGGSESSATADSFGRIGKIGEEKSLKRKDSEGECSCGKNTDNHYHCPGCDEKYSDETNVTLEHRTKMCGCGFKFGC